MDKDNPAFINGINCSVKLSLAIVVIINIVACSSGQTEEAKQVNKTEAPTVVAQTFAWPFINADALPVRGGSTQGANVTLDTKSSEQWQALQESQLIGKERDRLAILALQGTFRTSFQFTEVAGFYESYTPSRPYFSWGTEYVHVLDDREDFIGLQHTLVMFFTTPEGLVSEPMVMKHWRQDWQYQQKLQFSYRGKNQWRKQANPAAQESGQWTQSVYQVDDSPRYQAIGRWKHQPQFSSWHSATFTRPLPRREYSVRDDYDIMQGQHSITLTPTGWIHQQDNQKIQQASQHVIAQEIGLNRYQRIIDQPLEAAAQQYWQDTGGYWQAVRKTWQGILSTQDTVQLKRKVDGRFLFEKHFSDADAFAQTTEMSPDTLNAMVTATIAPHVSGANKIQTLHETEDQTTQSETQY